MTTISFTLGGAARFCRVVLGFNWTFDVGVQGIKRLFAGVASVEYAVRFVVVLDTVEVGKRTRKLFNRISVTITLRVVVAASAILYWGLDGSNKIGVGGGLDQTGSSSNTDG